MKKILAGAALALAMLLPTSSSAWWDKGHMQIAALAYDRLDPTIRDRVAVLIRLNPDYASWVKDTAPADRDRVAFVRAATWADDIKVPAHGYTNDGETPKGPEASQNIGYADRLMHKYWHYMDIPFTTDGSPTHDANAVNALNQIKTFTATLASNASDDVKSYDLVWLLHLVGDAHQPLHATSRFTHSIPGDAGGNSEKVKTTAGEVKSLHAFWDSQLGSYTTPPEAISAAATLPPPDPIRAVISDPRVWFDESFAAAKAFVYTAAIGDAPDTTYTLPPTYETQALEIATRQAAVAAARLAALLNAAVR